MPEAPQSKAVEDFLKAVYALQQHHERVSTNALSEALARSAPSVTDMAQRLAESGLVDYVKHRGVRLTDEGQAIALKVIRRHRLIEAFLVSELNYGLHEVHEEAEKLEHAVSDRFIDALADKLDHPPFDPHGDPIPGSDGQMIARQLVPLAHLPPNLYATVAQFSADGAELLQFILALGFQLGEAVEVAAREPFEGPLTIRFSSGQQVRISLLVANAILVEKIT
jgi:DtxR family Mn-dependent transcriptional regulator